MEVAPIRPSINHVSHLGPPPFGSKNYDWRFYFQSEDDLLSFLSFFLLPSPVRDDFDSSSCSDKFSSDFLLSFSSVVDFSFFLRFRSFSNPEGSLRPLPYSSGFFGSYSVLKMLAVLVYKVESLELILAKLIVLLLSAKASLYIYLFINNLNLYTVFKM